MKYSYQWLKEYVDFSWAPEELANRMTMAGLEVGTLDKVGDDVCLDAEVTSNRPDWNGHLSAAREISALTGNYIQKPEQTFARVSENILSSGSVTVEDAKLCPRYTAQLIRGVTIKESPAWLQQRLLTIGLRPINVVVDVTNYVMHEYNQPLHAFDYEKLNGSKIIVRRANKEETITAIDEKEYRLDPEMLVIADADRAVAIAGVMGGAATEISQNSTMVLMESAAFHPLNIRKTSKQLGLSSDSSYRFERGVDVQAVLEASNRAVDLIVSLAGGEVVGEAIDINTSKPEEKIITLSYRGLRRALSLDVGVSTIEQILSSLDLDIVDSHREGVSIKVPSFRPDLNLEVDLIEEVARIHGYDKIETKASFSVRVPRANPTADKMQIVHNVLTGAGFYECMSDSFLLNSMDQYQNMWNDMPALSVRNPVRQEQALLRKSLLPSLLLLCKNNENAGHRDARLYEVAHAYHAGDKEISKIQEPELLSFLGDMSFLEMKGVVSALLDALHISVTPVFEPVRHAIFTNAASMSLDGHCVGFLGETSKPAAKQAGLKSKPMLCELRIHDLFASVPDVLQYQDIFRFPPVLRDLAILVDDNVRWQDVQDLVKKTGGELLREVRFFDLYRDDKMGADKKSLAFSLVYQAPDRTLTTAEIDKLQNAIVSSLKKKLSAAIRD